MSKSSTSEHLAQVRPGTVFVGVDLHLRNNLVVVIDEKGKQQDQFGFPHDRSGYDYFLKRLEKLRDKCQASGFVVAMEPTNYFWKTLACYLEDHQVPYRLVNPYTVKKHREGDNLDRSKDDPRDGWQIAELARIGKYTETRLQTGAYEEVRQMITLYHQTQAAIWREKQIIWGLVGQIFPELLEEFKDLSGETVDAMLSCCAAAATIRQLSEDAFLQQVREAFRGRRLMVKRLRAVYQRASTSIGLREGLQAIQTSLHMHVSRLQLLLQQQNEIVAALSVRLETIPESRYLLSIPAIGPVSVALLLAEVGDPKRYRSGAQWVKLAGTQPVPNTSGKKQRSLTPMSKQGRPGLRYVLYFAVLRLIQTDAHFQQLYQHLQRRKTNPLTKMQALGVLMNKLLHILWALIHNQTLYTSSVTQST